MERPSRLMNKNFFLLWQGQLVSQVGSQAFHIAVMFWIKHGTGSATIMGLVMMLGMLPAVFLGPIGGTFADRYSRRKIIILSDVLNGIAVLCLARLVFSSWFEVETTIAFIFVIVVFSSIVSSFFRPAISASIPDIVPEEKVAAANSMNQFSVQLSTFLGQGAGGVLFRVLGAPVLFLIDGITYLFSAGSETLITIPQVFPEKVKGFGTLFRQFRVDTVEGFRYAWKQAGLRHLFIAAAILNFFGAPFIVLLPFYIEDFLKVKPDWYGFLLAGFGIGSMIGYLFAGAFKLPGKVRSKVIILAVVLEFVGFALLGVILIPIVSLILMFLIGVLNGFININIITILQITTPTQMRGRVFGLLGTISAGLMPISMGLTGVVADLVNQNVPLVYVACGGISAILSIVLALSREFRLFLAYERKEE